MHELLNWNIVLYGIVLPFVSAMILVFWIHPLIVRIARLKNIVDNPNIRKLQKEPVPVLGGVAVFWGIVGGVGLTSMFFNSYALFTSVVVIMVMLYIGTADDIIGLSPLLRIVLEVMLILFVIQMDRAYLNDFHGLFGLHRLPVYLSIPLSVVAGVGIVNAINMIDGVDGLSSGFCIMACLAFGAFFCMSFDGTMTVMCVLTAGALVPFFLHNVFGKESKMFIGDGGTLMMGMLMSVFCFHTISHTSRVAYNFPNMGVVAFCLSVLSIPVFDTLRVMIARMIRGISPFSADKTHLHHLFIEIGFSHAGTTLCVVCLNAMNMLLWLLTYQLGGNATVQLLVVLVVGIANTTGFYYIVRRLNHRHFAYRLLFRLALMTHMERGPFFLGMRKWLDKI
ncbi:MAG: glycosyltransferase family 4 protein [Prevotella sp.]